MTTTICSIRTIKNLWFILFLFNFLGLVANENTDPTSTNTTTISNAKIKNKYFAFEPFNLEDCRNSINFEFYDGTPAGLTVDNIPTTGALSTGIATSFDISALQTSEDPGDSDSFAVRFTGEIFIEESNTYTFFTASDDGSKLFINNIEVVDNDGIHGIVEESGSITLDAGFHSIVVLFFERNGGESLTVSYESPTITKTEIPFENILLPDCIDSDGDGVIDALDICNGFDDSLDNDNDGVPDGCDDDDDNDGLRDAIEESCGPAVAGFDAYWPLEGNSDDSSANNFDAVTESLSFVNDSKRGNNAGAFNGTSNLLRYSDGTFLNQAISFFTYSFWIKPANLNGIQTLLDEGGATNGIAIRLNQNVLEAAVREGGVQLNTSIFIFPDDDNWHHIGLTYDNGNVVLYFDGLASTTLNTGFAQLSSHTDSQGFGLTNGSDAYGAASGNFYEGLMDEIVHYPIALTSAQINQLVAAFCNEDSDGLVNIFDNDSDDDGCFDAIEGDGGFEFADMNADGQLIGGVASNGIPTVAGTGQNDVSSQDGLVTAGICLDTDGDNIPDEIDICIGFDDNLDFDNDGIPDGCDQDDDNDGILDIDECPFNILWVTQGTASSGEQNTIDKIIALGHNVTIVDDNVTEDANNYDAIFIFEDVISGNVINNLQNFETTVNGVVTSEVFLYDNVFGSANGSVSTTSIVEIVNNSHFITSGLALDDLDIGNGNRRAPASLSSGTILGRHPNGEGSLVIWTKGENLDTGIAPGRRVMVPHANDGGTDFNDQGEDLLVNAIIWAAEDSDPSLCDSDNDGAKNSQDNDSDEDGCFDALEGDGGFTLADVDVNGQLTAPIDADGIPGGTSQNDVSSIDDSVISDACDSDNDDDNDGVTNDLDLCPDTPDGETVDADGCSDSQLDDDNDGVTNDLDLCPDTPDGETVDANGCSDSQLDDDNDGVTNDLDLCPDTPDGETVDANGCSDSQLDDDNDGVTNDLDLCPDTPDGETVDANGCSDSQLDDDNDGVTNDLDLCPDTPDGETVDADGCSDSQLDDDNDGVTNNLDLCPDTPDGATVNADGCAESQLDDDNDGVTNDIDLCPDTPNGEAVNADGCSDSQLDDDNDGVTNDLDLCPDTPDGETVDTDGCSDSQLDDDNDGVNNDEDICPDTPEGESVNEEGCANSQTPDSDGDGITDGEETDNGTDINDPCDPAQDPGYVGYDPANSIWGSADCDGDGVNNINEFANGTDPYAISGDTDGDGIDDDNEIDNGTDLNDSCDPAQNPGYSEFDGDNNIWRAADCDSDGILNGEEFDNGTDPYLASVDTDGDGISDDIENTNGTDSNNPCDPAQPPGYTGFNAGNAVWGNADCDSDGVDNIDEFANGTDPYLASGDSDGDGISDDLEIENGTDFSNPCDPVQVPGYEGFNLDNTLWAESDCDGDTVANGLEVQNGTDPYLASGDTDGDGVIDDVEINATTDINNPCDPAQQSGYTGFDGDNAIWAVADCDGDGLLNGVEVENGTDPYTPEPDSGIDTDGDGISDLQEDIDGTNPNDSCDSIGGTPNATDDCDQDGLTNSEEITGLDDPSTPADPNGQTSDPDVFDTDGDTISDGQESFDGTNPNDACDSFGGVPPADVDCGAVSISSDLVAPNSNNGIFRIVNIENFPNNTVSIFNRWGVKVFEAQGYDNRNVTFNGISNARATLQESEELPAGVYFYIIEYEDNGTMETINGYLYINR